MQDLFRRLVGGRPAPQDEPAAPAVAPAKTEAGHASPRAPFTRDELPALLGERPGLAEFVAGRTDTVSPELGALPLAEAGLWLTFLGDAPRAAGAFRAAADAALPPARLGAADALAMARRESLPVEAGTLGGTYHALAGDEAAARRVWQQTVEQYGSLIDPESGPAALAERQWGLWQARLEEIDRRGAAAAREPEAEPFDPAKQGRICVALAYALLRVEDAPRAGVLLDVEAALRASAPDARLKRYYADLLALPGGLAGVLRGILASDGASGARSLAGAIRAYLKPVHPEAQAFVLDLQRAFPDRVPVLLPPADLTEALGARARKRLEDARR